MAKKKSEIPENPKVYKSLFNDGHYVFISKLTKIWPAFLHVPYQIIKNIPLNIQYNDRPLAVYLIETSIDHYLDQGYDETEFSGLDYIDRFVTSFLSSMNNIGHIHFQDSEKLRSIVQLNPADLKPPVTIKIQPSTIDHLKDIYDQFIPKQIHLVFERFNIQPLSHYLA